MSSENGEVVDEGGTSRINSPSTSSKESESKKQAAKTIIERYFYQLLDGCGNKDCSNEHCAIGGKLKLDANDAAAFAIRLFRLEAPFCNGPRIHTRTPPPQISRCTPYCDSPCVHRIVSLDEEKMKETLEQCEKTGVYAPIIILLGQVFSRYDFLGSSFLRSRTSPLPINTYTASELALMQKEQVRELEGEPEKDVDSSVETTDFPPLREVDMISAQRAIHLLFKRERRIFENALLHALTSLAVSIETDIQWMRWSQTSGDMDLMCNAALIAFELPAINDNDYLLQVLPRLCSAVSLTPVHIQAKIAMMWARYSQTRIESLLNELHHIISLKVIGGGFTNHFSPQEEINIISATKIMKILYYASIVAGELDPRELRDVEPDPRPEGELSLPSLHYTEDPLEKELRVSVLDCRKPLIPFSSFYNIPLSDSIEVDRDFYNYRDPLNSFSFMNYSFILSPATKVLGLCYDSRVRMFNERNLSFLQNDEGQPTNPYLRLKVHRDRIVEDALVELEMIAMDNPKDFKKQLVVEFDGEQGIDEGGVSKEFFQLIVEEIFNPDYGMFILNEDSRTYWFNPMSFESEAQFTLIGVVIGLAIYNNIILDVHFPMVVYRKLMGKKGSFADLFDWNQTLYNSLQYMLDFNEDGFEDIFMQTFRISYTDVFGGIVYHDLIQDGDSVPVTLDNRKKFVGLYADFLINSSIEKQFKAFKKGFEMVTDESPLHLLFRPEEVELLVCGSKQTFNIKELEETTEYDGGYTALTPIIKQFWELVHGMTLESQRKLLQFTTGSDRVPVGGFSKMRLIIARNGPDSDRLPTAHTCYNVLLLPEYDTKEKLQERLMKAITYSKGFGML